MRALVTGAGGFLGGALARALAGRGWSVRGFARGSYPEWEAEGIEAARGDLNDLDAVRKACSGVEVVFHAAAKVGLWGRYQDFHETNVVGTANLLKACREAGVGRLIYTSSPSVVFDGGDVAGVNESAPYPERFDSYYSQTKSVAEDMVLTANDSGLGAVALRPHLVWGPGDRHIVPRILAQGKAGQLRRIRGFDKLVDTTFITDAVEAHLLAAARLLASPSIGGKAYFISSGDPQPLWTVVNGILAAGGLPPAQKSVPYPAALAAAYLMEGVFRLLRVKKEPRLTVFLVKQLATAHWLDISAARRDLGYAPKVTVAEGLRRLSASLRGSVPRPSAP